MNNVGKKFRNDWVFRNLNFTFSNQSKFAILGRNGSGKSTLLQILSGLTIPSEGEVIHFISGKEISPDEVYREVVYAAPYVQLFEQLTLTEMIGVHQKFKEFYNGMNANDVIEKMYLTKHKDRQIEVFSSGMKQRLKLALAILSKSGFLLLDEPFTNMDQKGKDWYISLIDEFQFDRTIIVCSNHQEMEYSFCDRVFNLSS